MRIIAVANQKGGCAKTTTVVNLAAALAEMNHRVLVIDLDPQGNASQWLNAPNSTGGSFALLTETTPIESLISASGVSNLSVIAASQELANVEKALAGKLAIDAILKRRLAKIDTTKWDYVLIDTPPTLGIVTLNALVAAKELLIPVTTHVLTLSGVAQLMTLVSEIQDVLNPELEILGFLASRVDARTKHSKEVLELLTERFGAQVLATVIRENIRLAEAPSYAMPIIEYDSNCVASTDYRSLAKEVIQRRKR